MARGTCLCGSVGFELDNDGIVLAVGCYCENCRKVSGSQYGVYFQVRPQNFRWLWGDDTVATHESSPGNKRAFCKTCGCVAPVETAYGVVRVPGGALDDDPGVKPQAVLFSEKKAGWCAVDGAQHVFADSGPAEFWRNAIVRPVDRG